MYGDVRVIIWDLDGTLYPANPEIYRQIRAGEYAVIAKSNNWSLERAISEFDRVYKKQIKSATETVAHLSRMPVDRAIILIDSYCDRKKFLSPDLRLSAMFKRLAGYKHYVLANGAYSGVSAALKKLGLNLTIFAGILTVDKIGVAKPSPAGFEFIIHDSGYKPWQILSVGDRPEKDLLPASLLGMKTLYIGTGESPVPVDGVAKKIYEVPEIIIKKPLRPNGKVL